MRINDGSKCSDCDYFEHVCDYDICYEYCHCGNDEVKYIFNDEDTCEIVECSEFEEAKINNFGDMRSFNEEESKIYNKALKGMFKPTGERMDL